MEIKGGEFPDAQFNINKTDGKVYELHTEGFKNQIGQMYEAINFYRKELSMERQHSRELEKKCIDLQTELIKANAKLLIKNIPVITWGLLCTNFLFSVSDYCL